MYDSFRALFAQPVVIRNSLNSSAGDVDLAVAAAAQEQQPRHVLRALSLPSIGATQITGLFIGPGSAEVDI